MNERWVTEALCSEGEGKHPLSTVLWEVVSAQPCWNSLGSPGVTSCGVSSVIVISQEHKAMSPFPLPFLKIKTENVISVVRHTRIHAHAHMHTHVYPMEGLGNATNFTVLQLYKRT